MTTAEFDKLHESMVRVSETVPTETDCPKCGSDTIRKVGPWGAFLACKKRSCNGTRRLPSSATTDAERLIALKQTISYIAEGHTPRVTWMPADSNMLTGFAFSVMSSW